MNKRITIMDLANRLQLSKGSVSKALHDSKEISSSTRKKVRALAVELGYQPSAVARAIRTGRAFSVGLVLRTDAGHHHKPFLSSFLDGISQRLGSDGYTLTLATATDEASMLKNHQDLIAKQSVDAFILPRTMLHDSRAKLLHQQGIPFVMYGRTSKGDDYAWFDIDQEGYFAKLIDTLYQQGHRRFAYLGGDQTYYYEHLRYQGFMQGMHKYGINDYACIKDIVSLEQGKQTGYQLLQMEYPPTAFVCALDRTALGVIQAANDLGLQVGKHVSVAGYDGIPEGDFCQPGLSTCEVNNFDSGFHIADMVLRQIGGEKACFQHKLVEAKAVWKGSTGPVQQPSVCVAGLINNKTEELL